MYNNPVGIKKNERLNCECGIRDWVVLVFFVEINNFNLIDLTLFSVLYLFLWKIDKVSFQNIELN